jgi:hypothetical protein
MKVFSAGIPGLLLVFGLVLGGCESLGEAFFGSGGGYPNSGGTYSYVFSNQSSHTVTVTVESSSFDIVPGDSRTVSSGSSPVRYYYSPNELVWDDWNYSSKVTFRNKSN